MTVPGWNAQQYHEKMQRRHSAPGPSRPPSGRHKKLIGLALAAVVFGAITVAATQEEDPTQRIGVCHATGAEGQPYVWLVVDEDSFEHGHHRNHEGDFFRPLDTQGCGDDVLAAEPEANVTDEGNETADEAADETDDSEVAVPDEADDNATGDADDADEMAADEGAAEDNATAEAGGDEAASDDNATEAPEESNETAPAPGDAWVAQEAWQDDYEVVLTMTVGNDGESDAVDVTLNDSLPDVRRTWHLGGADADACVLEGNELSCWFGDLAPGETRQVELQAYTDRMACGFSLTNTAEVAAVDDPEARNDASSASIQARSC